MNKTRLLVFALLFGLLLPASLIWAADADKTVNDLTKAYEIWKNRGIKFVVRDSKGHFVAWNVGKLESWGGKSHWVIRDQKGHFLTNGIGNIENWKNGQTRLVLRDKKGHLLTHVGLNITSSGSFAQNIVGLRKLKNEKYLGFVQETISELLLIDLKKNDLVRTHVMLTYVQKYKARSGINNFKPVIRVIARQLNFMEAQNPNPKVTEMAAMARELLKDM